MAVNLIICWPSGLGASRFIIMLNIISDLRSDVIAITCIGGRESEMGEYVSTQTLVIHQ